MVKIMSHTVSDMLASLTLEAATKPIQNIESQYKAKPWHQQCEAYNCSYYTEEGRPKGEYNHHENHVLLVIQGIISKLFEC